MNTHEKVSLRYKLEILRAGKVVVDLPFIDHMITDAGLNDMGGSRGQNGWLDMVKNPILGEGVTPTAIRRDSGAVTFTQTGTTITASSGFFDPTDDGRLFKWGTGSAGVEGYLTYIDSTHATYTISQTVAVPEVGTIWYVNTAALQTPIAGLSWSTVTGALNNFNSSNVVSDVVTITSQTVKQSSAFAANKTLSEIAFTTDNANANVFDRDLINPTVAVFTGDQARVTIQTIVSYSPCTPQSAADVGTGCDTEGDAQLESTAMLPGFATNGCACYDSNGNQNAGVLFPYFETAVRPIDSAITLQSFNVTTYTDRSNGGPARNATRQSYGTGNFYLEFKALFSTSEYVGNLYGVALVNQHFQTGCLYVLKFDNLFAKSSLETVEVTFRKSWSRVLTN